MQKTVPISERKSSNINHFEGKNYIHITDKFKGKTLTFSECEFNELMLRKNKILKAFRELNDEKKKHKEGTKKIKKMAVKSKKSESKGKKCSKQQKNHSDVDMLSDEDEGDNDNDDAGASASGDESDD